MINKIRPPRDVSLGQSRFQGSKVSAELPSPAKVGMERGNLSIIDNSAESKLAVTEMILVRSPSQNRLVAPQKPAPSRPPALHFTHFEVQKVHSENIYNKTKSSVKQTKIFHISVRQEAGISNLITIDHPTKKEKSVARSVAEIDHIRQSEVNERKIKLFWKNEDKPDRLIFQSSTHVHQFCQLMKLAQVALDDTNTIQESLLAADRNHQRSKSTISEQSKAPPDPFTAFMARRIPSEPNSKNGIEVDLEAPGWIRVQQSIAAGDSASHVSGWNPTECSALDSTGEAPSFAQCTAITTAAATETTVDDREEGNRRLFLLQKTNPNGIVCVFVHHAISVKYPAILAPGICESAISITIEGTTPVCNVLSEALFRLELDEKDDAVSHLDLFVPTASHKGGFWLDRNSPFYIYGIKDYSLLELKHRPQIKDRVSVQLKVEIPEQQSTKTKLFDVKIKIHDAIGIIHKGLGHKIPESDLKYYGLFQQGHNQPLDREKRLEYYGLNNMDSVIFRRPPIFEIVPFNDENSLTSSTLVAPTANGSSGDRNTNSGSASNASFTSSSGENSLAESPGTSSPSASSSGGYMASNSSLIFNAEILTTDVIKSIARSIRPPILGSYLNFQLVFIPASGEEATVLDDACPLNWYSIQKGDRLLFQRLSPETESSPAEGDETIGLSRKPKMTISGGSVSRLDDLLMKNFRSREFTVQIAPSKESLQQLGAVGSSGGSTTGVVITLVGEVYLIQCANRSIELLAGESVRQQVHAYRISLTPNGKQLVKSPGVFVLTSYQLLWLGDVEISMALATIETIQKHKNSKEYIEIDLKDARIFIFSVQDKNGKTFKKELKQLTFSSVFAFSNKELANLSTFLSRSNSSSDLQQPSSSEQRPSRPSNTPEAGPGNRPVNLAKGQRQPTGNSIHSPASQAHHPITENRQRAETRSLTDAFVRDQRLRIDGWKIYNIRMEFERQFRRIGYEMPVICSGGTSFSNQPWRLSGINHDYSVCASYPRYLCVPSSIDDASITSVFSFRTKGRIPVLTYLHRNGHVICRASQPKVGLMNKCIEDQFLIEKIMEATPNPTCLWVFDARPKSSALANHAKGAGYEDASTYPNCHVKFLKIDNIHAVRNSFKALKGLCSNVPSQTSGKGPLFGNSSERHQQDLGWFSQIDNTKWFEYIRLIIKGATRMARTVHEDDKSLLVHCSDGWDRTTQLACLAQLMLDPFFRTIVGFEILIEKDWLSFGHKFAQRFGQPGKYLLIDEQRSPVFYQFMDCVFQILREFPDAFEFSEEFLLEISDHATSCRFGTFLFNSEKERRDNLVFSKTPSLWAHLNRSYERFSNVFYKPNSFSVIFPSNSMKSLHFWEAFYLNLHDWAQKKTERERSHHRVLVNLKKQNNSFRLENESLKQEVLRLREQLSSQNPTSSPPSIPTASSQKRNDRSSAPHNGVSRMPVSQPRPPLTVSASTFQKSLNQNF